MSVKTLKDLLVHGLSDIANAEKQLSKALPKMAKSATNPDLAETLRQHVQEATARAARIEEMSKTAGLKLERIKCAAMEGLIEECKEAMEEGEKGPVLDAALVGCLQKIKHYGIATYGTLAAQAKHLKMAELGDGIKQCLEEEKAVDKRLTQIATAKVQWDAEMLG